MVRIKCNSDLNILNLIPILFEILTVFVIFYTLMKTILLNKVADLRRLKFLYSGPVNFSQPCFCLFCELAL